MAIKSYYPLAADLKGKILLILGAGKVAERKIKFALSSQAKIIVVALAATVYIKELARRGKITLLIRGMRRTDIHRADLIIAATSSQEVNRKVSGWAKEKNKLVNVVDNPALSTFISPAVFKKGKVAVAVYTNAQAPALSRDLKNFLKENWGEFIAYRNKL